MERPILNKDLDSAAFRNFYYLKEELIAFCRANGLPTSGGKIEITDRIAFYLDKGIILSKTTSQKKALPVDNINLDTIIEENFVCSEKIRAFFKEHIGKNFSFNVAFQNWLKTNSGKTYKEAISAYLQILEDKKKGKMTIAKQFEYNTYIRAFFEHNQGKSLEEAIQCWKYKKQLPGHNAYEDHDLIALT